MKQAEKLAASLTPLDNLLPDATLLVCQLHSFFGGTEPPRALLVHFGTWSLHRVKRRRNSPSVWMCIIRDERGEHRLQGTSSQNPNLILWHIFFKNGCRCLLLNVIYHAINGHVQNSPGSHDIEQAVDILKNGNHHLIFIFRSRSVESRARKEGHDKNLLLS